MNLKVIWRLMRADIQERTRRYSFLVTMLAAVYLGYAVYADDVMLDLDHHRGVYNSAWLGIVLALSTTLFVSLVGFFIIKGTIQRDRQTRVGEVLATTPMGKLEYILGKMLSNFSVLMLIVAVQALAALAMQLLKSEDRHLDLWALLSPFLLIATPAMAFIAGLAVFFESVRWLRGGFGNIFYFFLWGGMLAYPVETRLTAADLSFLRPVQDSMADAMRPLYPDYKDGFSLNAGGGNRAEPVGVFVWDGLTWSPAHLAMRAGWLGYALILGGAASLLFDRFDTSKLSRLKLRNGKGKSPATGEESEAARPRRRMPRWTFPGRVRFRSRFLQLTFAELLLALKGLPYWWYAVAGGLIIASLASPVDAVKEFILPALWLWPVLQWSGIGVRESLHRTDQVVFSSPAILRRQFPAMLAAGVVLALIMAGGVAARLAAGGEWGALSGIAAGALFVPSMALAMGVWTGSSKAFEAVYTFLWYIGPMHHVPELDFIGVSPATVAAGMPPVFAAAAAGLILVAYAGRRRQLLMA